MYAAKKRPQKLNVLELHLRNRDAMLYFSLAIPVHWFNVSILPSPDVSTPTHVPEGLTEERLWMNMTKVKDENKEEVTP